MAYCEENVKASNNKYPKTIFKKVIYGTAGFRDKAVNLDYVVFRMGLLAALRSKATNAVIGVMITASHNPEEDNGVKLIDPMGEMLTGSWENCATELVNVKDEEVWSTLLKISNEVAVDLRLPGIVFYARDTRASGNNLAQALKNGIQAMKVEFQDYGLLTTPQLHYIVRCANTQGRYGQASEQGYYDKLSRAFISLRGVKCNSGNYLSEVNFDGSNGIGALKLQLIMRHLNETLHVQLYNDASHGKLNFKCGADYVKVNQCPPEGMKLTANTRCLSVDGDADRIVYFYMDSENKFHLLDGDKIATLVAGYIQELVSKSQLNLTFGLVQTAYANGSSTSYITDQMKVPVACVVTGVKHLHHRASQFDIGVYFEANGHGTVLFNDHASSLLMQASSDQSLPEDQQHAATHLNNLIDLINQTTGDALSDMLLVETILHARQWNIQMWDAMYTDLPNRQLVVKVQDRTIFQTTDAERKCLHPAGLQDAIDILVAKYPSGRSFVRPSGTEDVVRIYAEADIKENADCLALEVSNKVYELAGGIGDKPK